MYELTLVDKPTKLITNVSRATLTVYPASKQTNTDMAAKLSLARDADG